jgi:hypothetical protein
VQNGDDARNSQDFVMSENDSESDGPTCPPMHPSIPMPAGHGGSQPVSRVGTEAGSYKEDAMQT